MGDSDRKILSGYVEICRLNMACRYPDSYCTPESRIRTHLAYTTCMHFLSEFLNQKLPMGPFHANPRRTGKKKPGTHSCHDRASARNARVSLSRPYQWSSLPLTHSFQPQPCSLSLTLPFSPTPSPTPPLAPTSPPSGRWSAMRVWSAARAGCTGQWAQRQVGVWEGGWEGGCYVGA